MTFLDVHLEALSDDRGLRQLRDRGLPCAISITPLSLRDGSYRADTTALIRELVQRPGSVLGQQGLLHQCRRRHRFTDPWHENACPWRGPIPAEQQREFMSDGKRQLTKAFGLAPQLYVPPNHLYDDCSVQIAAELDFRFLADQDCLGLPPHHRRGVIVVPETKLGRGRGSVVYVHYHEIGPCEPHWNALLGRGLDQWPRLVPQRVHPARRALNREAKLGLKRVRDIAAVAARAIGLTR